ncbi:acetyl-CoA carboxylase carboxyl transferase subunit beta [Methylacidimicrobium cyclopophantes]|uniref:Acetyl-coenzyme A carboxylase carboxyl transferase subunit beta n=1 Tax=Methylacidimicrobium cyclopophantes TaxID=1041766 RepID=A0A5E6MMU8_9BACT|nr:acetyl-CoA carboxylase, carboxyltransferase subunit beta [Methylacidimicrobium cyclopophantes]VVM06744.1 acetyl-CoA carboxylase carboxyl transferase subunit beta [Methylacidimicrobium cyclopophantes]
MNKSHDRTRAPRIPSGPKREIPKGLWMKCPQCEQILYTKELEQNQRVCKHCQHHFPLPARERILLLTDPGSFTECDSSLSSVDPLGFQGVRSYADRLAHYRKESDLTEAVISGVGRIEGRAISLAVMDFQFLGGSMGSVVGEKITRAIERGARERLPVVIVSASGGARMYEGMLSLLQMAKTSAALVPLREARMPYLSILTNPTMAGVTASFASLGDIILAEPRAMIGFAGARVIRETTHQELPKGFQTAEFLYEKGLIDQIVHRHRLRSVISAFLSYLAPSGESGGPPAEAREAT